ncbi:AAA family ATPase [Bosea sp. NPDC055353]
MRFAHTTIAVAGTHSTGKSTFLDQVERRLLANGVSVGRVVDTASRARAAGFPILRDHVYESTLWIMAEGLRQEMEAALKFEVVLVDRPLLDALGYLLAALDATGRRIDEIRRLELERIALAHQARYDWFAATVLDKRVPLGPDRDADAAFRQLAGDKIGELVTAHVPTARWLTVASASELIDEVVKLASRRH